MALASNELRGKRFLTSVVDTGTGLRGVVGLVVTFAVSRQGPLGRFDLAFETTTARATPFCGWRRHPVLRMVTTSRPMRDVGYIPNVARSMSRVPGPRPTATMATSSRIAYRGLSSKIASSKM